MISSRLWHKSFLTLLPITRTTADNFRRQNINEKILVHRSEDEAPLQYWDQDTLHEKVREVAACWPHCPSSGEQSVTPKGCPWVYGSSRGERAARVTSISPRTVGHFWGGPTLVLKGMTAGNLIVTEKEERASNNQVPSCNAQVVILRSFCHPKSQVGGAVWLRNLARCRSAWFRSSNQKPLELVCPCPGRGANS